MNHEQARAAAALAAFPYEGCVYGDREAWPQPTRISLPAWQPDDPQEWRDRAACRGVATELFYPNGRQRGDQMQAIAICEACPVRTDCLQWALANFDNRNDYGVWGGTTAKQRRGLRAEYNARRRAEAAA